MTDYTAGSLILPQMGMRMFWICTLTVAKYWQNAEGDIPDGRGDVR
jgi:hypothetical protein